MPDAGLQFAHEMEIPLYYKNHEAGDRRVYFLVVNILLIRLEALSDITSRHYAQVIIT
jgi:hypothetical protein